MFCLVFRQLIQITAPYERLGLTTAVKIHFMVFGGKTNSFPALHKDAFGFMALVNNMLITSRFTIQGDTHELGRRIHLYKFIVNNFNMIENFHFLYQLNTTKGVFMARILSLFSLHHAFIELRIFCVIRY